MLSLKGISIWLCSSKNLFVVQTMEPNVSRLNTWSFLRQDGPRLKLLYPVNDAVLLTQSFNSVYKVIKIWFNLHFYPLCRRERLHIAQKTKKKTKTTTNKKIALLQQQNRNRTRLQEMAAIFFFFLEALSDWWHLLFSRSRRLGQWKLIPVWGSCARENTAKCF